MRFEGIAASLVLLLLVGLAQALALDGDGGEDAALKLSQLPSGSILLQDWEDYALSPELLQPLTVPPMTTTTIKNQDGRDGCPAEQPNFFWRCARPRWQGCGYGQECCCGKCHPKKGLLTHHQISHCCISVFLNLQICCNLKFTFSCN